ncbi:hypothetical protein MC885_005210 [Smutsia gigantea]|nr:hypothetical protein MC885_005210 [Smutsia gigantea]
MSYATSERTCRLGGSSAVRVHSQFYRTAHLPCERPDIRYHLWENDTIWVRKTSDSTKMRIYLGQLQRGLFVIRRRSAA